MTTCENCHCFEDWSESQIFNGVVYDGDFKLRADRPTSVNRYDECEDGYEYGVEF